MHNYLDSHNGVDSKPRKADTQQQMIHIYKLKPLLTVPKLVIVFIVSGSEPESIFRARPSVSRCAVVLTSLPNNSYNSCKAHQQTSRVPFRKCARNSLVVQPGRAELTPVFPNTPYTRYPIRFILIPLGCEYGTAQCSTQPIVRE